MQRTLRADWPQFVKLVLDERGVLLACFAAERLSAERRADLHEYMNRLLHTHPAAAEFGVSRDPGRWGCLLPAPAPADGAPPAPAPLVYARRPPWVPNDVLGSHKALEHNKALLSAQAGAAKPAAAEAGAPSAAP